jgi:hypothetical protein
VRRLQPRLTPGPVSVMEATSSSQTPAQRLARYTPTLLTAPQWMLAQAPVTAAVLAAVPADADDAARLASRLCRLLVDHPGWDRSEVPDLAVLVTAAGISAHIARLAASGTSSQGQGKHLCDLRRLTHAVAGTVAPARGTAGKPSAPSAATRPLLAWLTAGVPPLTAVRAYEQSTSRALSKKVLNRAADDARAASAAALTPGTLAALSAVGAPAWKVVSPRTWARSSSESTSGPARSAPRSGSTSPDSLATAVKPSRAAVLRAARTAAAARSAPTVAPAPDVTALPSAVQTAIAEYTPVSVTAERWEVLAPMCRRLVVGYGPVNAGVARTSATIIAAFVAWAQTRPGRTSTDSAVAIEELQAPGLLETYLTELASDGTPDASLATYRSVLRRTLKALDPNPPAAIAYQPVAGPYSAAECAAYVRLARNQPTTARRRELSTIIGLGLGAGLDGRDLRAVSPTDLSDAILPDGTIVLLVQVRGGRPRTVPVRAMYTDLVREALALHAGDRRGASTPLLGAKLTRKSITSPAKRDAVTATATDTGVDMAVNRLRATWLVACLAAGIGLGPLLHAAGLRSARTLTDLLAYCPPPNPDDVNRLLATLPAGTGADLPAPSAAPTLPGGAT